MSTPSLELAKHCIRELSFSERFTVLSQGFHFGTEEIRCYTFRALVEAVGKREYNNPGGGVRDIDRDTLLAWLKDVVGDVELTEAVRAAFGNENSIAERMDTVRTILYVRLRQYEKTLKDEE